MSATLFASSGTASADAAVTAALAPVATVEQARRTFGAVTALDGVTLSIASGEIHALVGPNGAGKTTLLRVLTGLVDVDSGSVRVSGLDPARSPRAAHRVLGVVHSGTRSFYLRLSGLENLIFFARLHGLRRKHATARAHELLNAVDLDDAAGRAVSTYSTGMQRRLAVARALLPEPRLLLVDEATHDLDPHAATRVRDLIRAAARSETGVLWTTQRLEEIRGFADRVTLLDKGAVRFTGTVSRLLLHAAGDQYLLRLTAICPPPPELTAHGRLVGTVAAADSDGEHYMLTLAADATLGDALAALAAGGATLLGCTEARPSVEDAFLALVSGPAG